MHPFIGSHASSQCNSIRAAWQIDCSAIVQGKKGGERLHVQHFWVLHCEGKHVERLHVRHACLLGTSARGMSAHATALAVLRCTVRLAQLNSARATLLCCVCVLRFVLCVCLCCGFLYFFVHGAHCLFLCF